jgi:Subtilase family
MQQNTSGRKILWSFVALGLALGLLLSSCGQVTPENATLEAQGPTLPLVGLNGKQLFAYAQTNCPIDQFDIPGQGFRARGASGGLAVVEPPYPTMPTAITNPATVGEEVYSLAALSTLSRDVTILVVDDFNGDTTISPVKPSIYKLGRDVFTWPGRSAGLSAAPLARATQLDTEVRRLEATNQIAHGTLVMNFINTMILGTDAYDGGDLNIGDDGKVSIKNRFTGKYIHVQAVDTEDLDTTFIAPRMQAAIQNALTTNKQIIVNMSFAIVPCTVKSDFAANRSRFPSFPLYANAVADANDALRGSTGTTQFRGRVYRQLTTPFDNDPLHTVIKSPNNTGALGVGGNLIYIAASGNFGLGYSMYPAAWPEVVSASSNDAGAGRSGFSNYGEVMVTGAWYTLTDPANINGVGFGTDKVVYAGTSFSSPALAVFSAFDLARATPKCETEFSATLAPIPDIAHSPIDDKPLAQAILTYCD